MQIPEIRFCAKSNNSNFLNNEIVQWIYNIPAAAESESLSWIETLCEVLCCKLWAKNVWPLLCLFVFLFQIRMQAQGSLLQGSMMSNFINIYQTEGTRGLWRVSVGLLADVDVHYGCICHGDCVPRRRTVHSLWVFNFYWTAWLKLSKYKMLNH